MNISVPKPVNEIIMFINSLGFDAYVYGSTVRKMILGEKIKVYYLRTGINLEVLLTKLKKYSASFDRNKKIINLKNGKFKMIIANYVSKENSLEKDLNQEVFTMNAMALSEEDGLIDYGTGLKDIRDKIIKTVGNDDKTIKDNPLSILQAIRLSAEYGMKMDLKTQSYLFSNADLLKNVSMENINREFSKLIVSDHCDFYIKKYFDIIITIIPELSLMENFNQNCPDQIYDLLYHTLCVMKTCENNLELRLCALFHDIAKPFTVQQDDRGINHYPDHGKKGAEITRLILNRLKYEKKLVSKVTKIIEFHDYQIPENELKYKEMLLKFDREELDILFKLKKANFYAKRPGNMFELKKIENDYERALTIIKKPYFVKKRNLKISGRDIVELGFDKNRINEILSKVYSRVFAGEVKNRREALLDYLKTLS